ncbi:MAG: hypothetical protein ACKO8I_08335, partial [Cyanobacteriota bacterium]
MEDLGRLALGLEQAGAYISQRRLKLSDCRSLATNWFTSYQQVSESARCLLRLALLSPEPIPESLLAVDVAGDMEGSGDGGEAFDVTPLVAPVLMRAVGM